MILLYRKENCAFCDEIEETLREIVMAYKIGNLKDLPESKLKNIPLLIDAERSVFGKKAIYEFLDEAKKLMVQWQKFQSDSCYLDDDGKVC